MNRYEFMKQLEALLYDLSPQERAEALKYYNDYFDDAGSENETNVLSDLGSPRQVADIIKVGLNETGANSGEFTEHGYTDPRFTYNKEMAGQNSYQSNQNKGNYNQQSYQQSGYGSYNYNKQNNTQPKQPLSGWKIALIVLLILIAIPIGGPVLLGAISLILGILVTLFCIFLAIAICAIAFILAGIIVFGVGIVKLFTIPPVGILTTGVGLILTAVGLLCMLLTIWICGTVLPACIRGIVALCRMPFKNRRTYA